MSPLENLSRLITGAVLEDAVDQLAIVSATLGSVPDLHSNESKTSIEELLMKMSEEEEGLGTGMTDMRQLQCETAYIQKVLESSIKEMYKDGQVTSLEKAVDAYKRRLSEKDEIIIREEKVRQEIEELTRQLDTLKATEVETRKAETRKIAELKDSYLDCRRRGGSEESYVESQEVVRQEERRSHLEEEEEHLKMRIRNLELDIEHEERVTTEVESFLRDQHLEFSGKLREWTQKYEEDTERKRLELEEMIERRRDGLEKLKSQTENCAETERFVEVVKLEKARLRAAQELEERREKSAVQLQAWWRGLMVRCCLGQFRKNKVLRTKLLKIQKDRAKGKK